MFSKNNRQMNQQKQGEKVTRYAIKKFSFGAASVAVACGIYFANGAAVQAESQDNVATTSLDHEVASETSHQPGPVRIKRQTQHLLAQLHQTKQAHRQHLNHQLLSRQVRRKSLLTRRTKLLKRVLKIQQHRQPLLNQRQRALRPVQNNQRQILR